MASTSRLLPEAKLTTEPRWHRHFLAPSTLGRRFGLVAMVGLEPTTFPL